MPSPIGKSQPAPNATTQIVTGPCTLNRVIVQAAAAAAVDFYDNTATAGTPICTIPASAAVGSVFQFDIPCAVGLRAVVGAGVQLTVTFGS